MKTGEGMSENLKLDMTVDEALAFAEEWTRGMTLHAGSQGWRVVCLLLGEEVKALREAVREREALSESRLEQMNADRKAFNDLRDELIKVKSQLAELRQGGEAVSDSSLDLRGIDVASHSEWRRMLHYVPEAEREFVLLRDVPKIIAKNTPQPAIPPGYVVLNDEQVQTLAIKHAAWGSKGNEFGVHFYAESLGRFVRELLSTAPSVPVAEKDAKDAARYRWLCDPKVKANEGEPYIVYMGEGIDAAIDAAMLAAPADSKEGES